MKKLIAFFLISVMLFTAAACACGAQQQTVTHRGEITVYCDNALTTDLLTYFQANQDCIVTGVLLNEKTDYKKLNETASVALVKDEAVIGKLLEAGWTETADFTDAQKEANAKMFNFTVLNAPSMTASGKESAKLLTDWLAGDGVYEKTLTSTSGCGCSCSKEEKVVKFKSDAPKLFESGQFQDLMDN
jgi:hypothetical protein